jgi:phosphoserine aminotransferase
MKDITTGRNKINFGSGPAALPLEVLQEASEAVKDYNGSGLSILEIPHRGKLFDAILQESKSLVKELCGLDDDYKVLWLQGGGRMQFCMIPMNFLGEGETAAYIDSGHWSAEAIEYAAYYGKTQVLASSKESNYTHLPEFPRMMPSSLSYLHFTTNNTIYGTQWQDIPKAGVPLIADMSSDILSRRRDYRNCAMFYAAAQKNIGPAGVTLCVIHKDMLTKVKRTIPPMLDYKEQADKDSVLNTPPVFAIYTSLLMLRWTKKRTIAAIEQESIRKAELIYNEIERNSLFRSTVTAQGHRSRMNVCFAAVDPVKEKGFVEFCSRHNITGTEGHRAVGGFRVSLYNAITVEEVEKLVEVMKEFEQLTVGN